MSFHSPTSFIIEPKVEVVNQQGGELYEAKVDAQEGTLLEMKLKH